MSHNQSDGNADFWEFQKSTDCCTRRTHAPVEASSGRCGAAALDKLESDRWQVASKRIMSGTGGYPTGRSDHQATRTFLHGA